MVTRRVELTDEQNEVLERLAASEGRSVSELIRAGVEVILSEGDARYLFQIEPRGSEQPPSLSEKESELLLQINRGLPPESLDRYRELMSRRRAGTLTPEEHQELLRLTGEAERLQVERIERLAELARLRGTSLGAVMNELGIRPSPNA